MPKTEKTALKSASKPASPRSKRTFVQPNMPRQCSRFKNNMQVALQAQTQALMQQQIDAAEASRLALGAAKDALEQQRSPRHDLAGHRVGNPTTRGRFWVYWVAQPGRPGCTGLCVWAPCSGRVRTISPLSNTPAQAQVQCRTGGFCCCPKTTQEPKTRLCFRNRKAFSEKG